jgi:hypothetical protein
VRSVAPLLVEETVSSVTKYWQTKLELRPVVLFVPTADDDLYCKVHA